MAWVYPQSIETNTEWYDYPNNYGILPALEVGDNEYAWTPGGITVNELVLNMGTSCSECQIRARISNTNLPFETPFLNVRFYDAYPNITQSELWTIDLSGITSFTDFSYTPSFNWNYIFLSANTLTVGVHVSVLQAQTGVLTTRRLLTGVGI